MTTCRRDPGQGQPHREGSTHNRVFDLRRPTRAVGPPGRDRITAGRVVSADDLVFESGANDGAYLVVESMLSRLEKRAVREPGGVDQLMLNFRISFPKVRYQVCGCIDKLNLPANQSVINITYESNSNPISQKLITYLATSINKPHINEFEYNKRLG